MPCPIRNHIFKAVADLLKSEPQLFAQIEGFADNTGKRFSNYLLSVQRAKNCFDFLVAAGVPAGRLKYLGYGIARPAASISIRKAGA